MADAEADDIPIMSDADFENEIDRLGRDPDSSEVAEILKMMNENRMISFEEAEQLMIGVGSNKVVKSGLPQQVRPSEPENETDVDDCIKRISDNDPTLLEINLNNMKRTPIPQIQKIFYALKDNTHLLKLSLANIGLSDNGAEPLIEMLQHNKTLKSLNLETNYMTGDFLARLFQAALVNQSLQECKVVNQGPSLSTQAEREIIESVSKNVGLTKCSINLRLPEGRHKVDNAMMRNGEIKRVERKNEAIAAKAAGKPVDKPEAGPKPVPAKTKPRGMGPVFKSVSSVDDE